MKTSNPYTPSQPVKQVPDTINGGLGTGKAKARYPSGHSTNQPGGGGSTGSMGTRAASTPGGPSGS